ncbi:MAG: class I SAM-dependent methyltransferase [Lachnospiraceae bacterium]|nr:class I SAM-dependent methyltransferase [Lachnospiraceae bacterium]
MEAYSGFAEVYDTFMDQTPYDEWCEYLTGLIGKYGISVPGEEETLESATDKERAEMPEAEEVLLSERNLVLELGCGTGNLTQRMAARGFDMIGVDNSQEMLSIAMEKRTQGISPLYLLQDMRELELYSTVGTVLCVCDSINYLLSEEDVSEVFRRVNNYLFPGGIFIFDFNTVYKYEQVIGDATIAESREDCSFIWENYYDCEEQVNEYDLTIFVKDADTERFRRFRETHYQRGYTAEQMTRLIREAGMRVELTVDADTHGAIRRESERIYILAREIKKGESRQ